MVDGRTESWGQERETYATPARPLAPPHPIVTMLNENVEITKLDVSAGASR